MAGKKSKKGKGAKSPKLPKRIAGVKVPKALREPGGKLLAAVQHPLVLDAAAAALVVAATAIRDGSKRGTGAAGDAASPERPASDLGAILATTALEGVKKLAAGTSAPKAGKRGS